MHKAMILAAGLGTRLQPLTNTLPKALVELEGKTLLQRAVDKLTGAGITFIVINIHHFPQLMRAAIDQLDTKGAQIVISDESEKLLDTGGGLLKAVDHFRGEEPFVVHNVDIISDVDLQDMLQAHLRENALATIAVSRRETQRYFLWDNNRLCGWKNLQTGQTIQCYTPQQEPEQLAFSCIHIINPRIFSLINEAGAFSINKVYLRLAEKHHILAYRHNPAYWADVGSLEKLKSARTLIVNNPEKF